MLWYLLAVVAGALIIWFLPMGLVVEFHQQSWQAGVKLELTAPAVRLKKSIDLSELVTTAVDHMLTRWRETGEPVKEPLQRSIRRMPLGKVRAALSQPLRYLSRRTRCPTLQLTAKIGGADAMQSALMVGFLWGLVGPAVGRFSSAVRLEPTGPLIRITPDFGGPVLQVHGDCILRLRFGHAIVAILWLLRRVMREREIVAWARDSWRRKGEKPGGRASDSRSNEDGHGEP